MGACIIKSEREEERKSLLGIHEANGYWPSRYIEWREEWAYDIKHYNYYLNSNRMAPGISPLQFVSLSDLRRSPPPFFASRYIFLNSLCWSLRPRVGAVKRSQALVIWPMVYYRDLTPCNHYKLYLPQPFSSSYRSLYLRARIRCHYGSTEGRSCSSLTTIFFLSLLSSKGSWLACFAKSIRTTRPTFDLNFKLIIVSRTDHL